MGDIYRVMVTRETELDDGDVMVTKLIELAAPREMLAQFAPAATAAALGTSEQVTDQQLDDARERLQDIGVISSNSNFGAGQPKRRRRTKAEMEAARRAELEAAAIAEPHSGMITDRDGNGEPIIEIDVATGPLAGGFNPFDK